MPLEIRIDLAAALRAPRVVVELGCGPRKAEGAIGIDRRDMPGVDIIADLEEGLGFLPDSCADELLAFHVLEHVERFEPLMREIVRVLKPSGRCRVAVPHFTNPYAASDYTHKRLCGLYTFYYFVEPADQLRRKVPTYSDVRIRVTSLRLIFGRRKRLLRFLTKCFGRFVNSSPRLQEWYEAKPWPIPCDEVQVEFVPVKK